ncbi:alpha/beta fold hydrolase [Subtercola sp. YIM 133946]|uniref:alpha/beta fold hydrolase n=1 Tax=Subtercola sp. YIM 133946 TaxID=3118909 RepID=UPI002F9564A9
MTALVARVSHTPARGQRSGPAVLLLHGFASDGVADWPADRWAEPLASAGRDVYVVDLPGHGSAGAIDAVADVSTAAILAAVDAAIEPGVSFADSESDTGTLDVVGYSLGARLAWDFAGTRPHRVRRLVLGGLSPVEPFAAVDTGQLHQFLETGTEPIDPLAGIMVQLASAVGRDPRSLLALVEGLGADAFDPARTPPQCSTLFVIGADDQMASASTELVALISGRPVVVEIVPGDHVGALAGDDLRCLTLDFLLD